jgi:hypothetical protein
MVYHVICASLVPRARIMSLVTLGYLSMPLALAIGSVFTTSIGTWLSVSSSSEDCS